MNTLDRTLRKAGCFLVFLLVGAAAYAQSTGTVTGQVSNAATKAFLEGARVTVENSDRFAVTDRQGRYELALPPGTARLTVAYIGLDPQELSVIVTAGQFATQNVELTSNVYAMEAYTVSGPREGSAYAITRQQQAPNVKNVVSSDSFGNIADGNIGDLLQNLPGITAVYVGADVRSVQIRGIEGSLNSVTMDGDRVASSQSAGLGRTFEFEQASLGGIETIEVIKAPTPDMDADSIGGNVNIISKSAFDRAQKRYFTYTLGGVYRPGFYTRSGNWTKEPVDNVGPSLNFGYADRFGPDERIGVSLNTTYHSQPGGDTAALMNYQNTLADPYYIYSVAVPRPAGAPRTRLATSGKVEFKLSDRTTFALNTSYNWFHENNDTRQMLWQTSQNVANFAPGYTNTFTEVLANASSNSTITTTTDDKSGRTWVITPSGRHRFPTMDIDYSLSISNSQTYYDYSPFDRHYGARPKGATQLSVTNIGFTIDRRESLQWPKITQTAGLNAYDLNNYERFTLTQNNRGGEDEIKSARLNVLKRFDWSLPTAFKVGGNVREQTRGTWSAARRYTYNGTNVGQFLDTRAKWSDSNEGYRQPPWPNTNLVAQDVQANPTRWLEDTNYAQQQRAAADRDIVETVSALYLMGTTSYKDFSVLAGIRMEDTKTEAEGPLQSGGIYTGRSKRKGGYRDTFPGLHLKYAPASGLVARASYSTSIGRPSFDALIPLEVINETNRTISLRNADLKPQYSDNFDLSVEYYFEPVGLLSASVFRKEIQDFQYTDTSFVGPGPNNGFNGLYEGFTLTQPKNGGSATYQGFELAYQQQFTFLPGFWKGFGAGANYTQLETEGNYGGTVATTQLAGFLPKAANFNISYIRSPFNIRVNAVWRGDYLLAVNANPALLSYQRPKFQVDLKVKYTVNPKLSFFCDIQNLNKSPITERYFGREDRPGETRIVVAKIVAGITGNF